MVINLPTDLLVYISSYMNPPLTLRILNKELNKEIVKEECSNEWKQLYNSRLKTLTKMPPISGNYNWKMEYCRIIERDYFYGYTNCGYKNDGYENDGFKFYNGEGRNLEFFGGIKSIPKEIGNLVDLVRLIIYLRDGALVIPKKQYLN